MQHESHLSRRNLLGAAAAGAAAIGTSTLLAAPAQAGSGHSPAASPRPDQRAALHPARPAQPSTSRPASPSSPRSATPASSTPASSAAPPRSSGPRWTTPACAPPPGTSASRSRGTPTPGSGRSRTPTIVGNKFIVHPFFGQGPNGPIRDGAVYRAFAADLNKAGAARPPGRAQLRLPQPPGGVPAPGRRQPDRLRHPDQPDRPAPGAPGGGPVLGLARRRRPGRPDPPAPRPDQAGARQGPGRRPASFADPGDGLIDFGRIFQHAREAGLIEYIVERDDAGTPPRTPADALTTARVGYDYLAGLRF